MQQRWLVITLLAVFVVCGAPTVSAQDSEAATVRPAADTAPAASGTASVEIDEGMRKILQKVGSVPCSERVRSRMYLLLFENNRQLHDRCFSDCGYQFFPASKDKATPEQIVGAATSKACVTLFSGVVLANFPECDVDFVSTRSCAEILMRVKKDVDEKQAVPTQKQFYDLYNLNRVINLLNENATLVEAAFRDTSTKISVWEMTKMMTRVYVSPDVMLQENMTILVRDDASASTTDPSAWREANVAMSTTDATSSSQEETASSSTGAKAVPASSGSADDPTATTETPTPTPSATAAATQETMRSSGASPSAGALTSMCASAVVGLVVFMCLYV